jgi:hypothetical protein
MTFSPGYPAETVNFLRLWNRVGGIRRDFNRGGYEKPFAKSERNHSKFFTEAR